MNWYSFLGYEYSFFNDILSRLIAFETLKSQGLIYKIRAAYIG